MSAVETSKDSAAFCADLVRTHDFSRYASTLFVPTTQRRALLAVYAFNVEIARVREQVSQPLPGEIRLQWWTDMLEGAGHGEVEGNPVAAELLRAIREFRLTSNGVVVGERDHLKTRARGRLHQGRGREVAVGDVRVEVQVDLDGTTPRRLPLAR